MTKIKVLHIIKTLNLGGAESNLLNVLQVADQNKFEMHVGYSFGGELEKDFIGAGARLFKYAGRNHRIQSPASFAIVFRIWKYLLKNKIDIIHTHNFSGHIWGVIAAKLAGKKIVEHVHDSRYCDPEDFIRRRGFNKQFRFIRFFRNLSDRVIVLTKQNVDFLLAQKIYPAKKIIELQNGIPIVPFSVTDKERITTTARLGIRADSRIILTPVRVSPEKNVEIILHIAAKVYRENPRVIFMIAGDGPLLKEFSDHVEHRHLAAFIRFVGFSPDVRRLLAVSEVMLLPSLLELHSIAILEAMSMKVPVVVSDGVGCNNEFIKNWENGVLLDPFSDDGWSEALTKILQDPVLKNSLGEAGYQTCVEKFDIKNTVKEVEGIYEQILCR